MPVKGRKKKRRRFGDSDDSDDSDYKKVVIAIFRSRSIQTRSSSKGSCPPNLPQSLTKKPKTSKTPKKPKENKIIKKKRSNTVVRRAMNINTFDDNQQSASISEPAPIKKKIPHWWKWPVGNRDKEIWTPSNQDMSFPVHSKKLEARSWFTLNNIVELMTMEKKNTSQTISPATSDPRKKPNSVIKVRLYPTKPQKKLLNKMFGTHRAIYNKVVEMSREDCYKLSSEDLDMKYRPISQKHSLTKYLPEYHLEVPEEVVNSTFCDYKKALDSSVESFEALKEKPKKEKKGSKISFPELKFKSRKDNSSSVEICDIISRPKMG